MINELRIITRLPFLNCVILTLSAASSASAYEWIEKMPQTLNQSTKYLVQTVVRTKQANKSYGPST